jgi:hypothetical protein
MILGQKRGQMKLYLHHECTNSEISAFLCFFFLESNEFLVSHEKNPSQSE